MLKTTSDSYKQSLIITWLQYIIGEASPSSWTLRKCIRILCTDRIWLTGPQCHPHQLHFSGTFETFKFWVKEWQKEATVSVAERFKMVFLRVSLRKYFSHLSYWWELSLAPNGSLFSLWPQWRQRASWVIPGHS